MIVLGKYVSIHTLIKSQLGEAHFLIELQGIGIVISDLQTHYRVALSLALRRYEGIYYSMSYKSYS